MQTDVTKAGVILDAAIFVGLLVFAAFAVIAGINSEWDVLAINLGLIGPDDDQ